VLNYKNLKLVTDLINFYGEPWYINAGTALFLHGLTGDLTDVDIRVFDEDIEALCSKIKRSYPNDTVLRPPLKFNLGVYDTLCIELRLDCKYDIYTRMRIKRDDLGIVDFPFNKRAFDDALKVNFEDLSLPVASLENLLIYYLVLRRHKGDDLNIKEIIANNNFDEMKFETMLGETPRGEILREIYETQYK
jgi:hypothetical protein